MRIANDIQLTPPEVNKPLRANLAWGVTAFHVITFLLLAVIVFATISRFKVEATILSETALLGEAKAERDTIEQQTLALQRKVAISDDITTWLSMSPPAQALTLLLARQVEPDISYTRLAIEMEPGAPNAKISIEFASSSPDNSSRQVNKIQSALEKAGFEMVNIEADLAIPEGWRYVTIVALPPKGSFEKLINPTL